MSALHRAWTEGQLSPPTPFASLDKVKSWTCWRKWLITEWKERQYSSVQKLPFLTFLIPKDLTVTRYNTNNYELSHLTDSWVAIHGNTGSFTGREFKEGWSHWLTEDLAVQGTKQLPLRQTSEGLHISFPIMGAFLLLGWRKLRRPVWSPVSPSHINTLSFSEDFGDVKM